MFVQQSKTLDGKFPALVKGEEKDEEGKRGGREAYGGRCKKGGKGIIYCSTPRKKTNRTVRS